MAAGLWYISVWLKEQYLSVDAKGVLGFFLFLGDSLAGRWNKL